jgi:hypothetical protein
MATIDRVTVMEDSQLVFQLLNGTEIVDVL